MRTSATMPRDDGSLQDSSNINAIEKRGMKMNFTGVKATFVATFLSALLAVGAGAASSNVVGLIQVEIPTGLSLMSVPFEGIGDGSLTLDNVLGDKLGDRSQVIMYNPEVGYETYTFFQEDTPEDTGWYKGAVKAGNTVLTRGHGFWIRNQSGASVEIVLKGQAPVADQNVDLPTGLRIIGFAFPAETEIQSLEGLNPKDRDQIIVFIPGVGYETYTYFEEDDPADTGWYKGAVKANRVISPGEGFWYRRSGAHTIWIQQAPYTL